MQRKFREEKRVIPSTWDGCRVGAKKGFVGEVTFGLALNEWNLDKGGCFLSTWNEQWKMYQSNAGQLSRSFPNQYALRDGEEKGIVGGEETMERVLNRKMKA